MLFSITAILSSDVFVQILCQCLMRYGSIDMSTVFIRPGKLNTCVYPACENSCPRRNHSNVKGYAHSLGKQFHISHAFQFDFINTFDIGKWSIFNLCIYPLKNPSQCQSNNSNGDNFKRSLTRIVVVLQRWKSSFSLQKCYADFCLTCKIKTTESRESSLSLQRRERIKCS